MVESKQQQTTQENQGKEVKKEEQPSNFRWTIDFKDDLGKMIQEEANLVYLTPTAYIKSTLVNYIKDVRRKRKIEEDTIRQYGYASLKNTEK